MKLKSVLTLSAVAAALMVSGVQNVRAADVTPASQEAATTATKATPAHSHKASHKAHKSAKTEKKMTEVKKDATEAPTTGQ